MITIDIIANSQKDLLEQIQQKIGGSIINNWNESILTIDNENAKGTLRFVPFDWGVNLLDFDITLRKEFVFKILAQQEFNPIRFLYPSVGSFKHRFGVDNTEKKVEQFQSLIFTNKTGGYNYLHFIKNEHLNLNLIEIVRKQFLQKRTSNVSSLNKKLYEVFVDTDHENRFSNYGTLNLKMADLIKKLKKVKGKGMLRILKIEAVVYEILSLHIQQHNRLLAGVPLPTSLDKSELKIIRKLSALILKRPEKDYSLEDLSLKSGLTQSKLQDGFKFLYNRTVTEYIRHVRLESARDLIRTTDLNISQIVYSIGFSSRSYFSKIFREKYDITPNQFKKKLTAVLEQ
ncbi:helix-turn-helix transcriptional regulator [Polaribacter sp. KT 15]|uniref:helix-turn-helix transcriptional regulator n=1 Tax=Polaribacter sp. KT 15 TaxID=1896175 RepID=UPI0009094A27|nr:AraC family transcriptional regulator [Polaribacter sp. KT 15]SHM99497.1 transcriptional regulator, AraC family [Polaribacter sp. KT 15]